MMFKQGETFQFSPVTLMIQSMIEGTQITKPGYSVELSYNSFWHSVMLSPMKNPLITPTTTARPMWYCHTGEPESPWYLWKYSNYLVSSNKNSTWQI